MAVIVGADGRLGRGLLQTLNGQHNVSLGRKDCLGWAGKDATEKIIRKLDAIANPGETVFVAAGLLDPRLSIDALNEINFLLPHNIINAAKQVGLNVVTFGTVLEGMMKSPNGYVRSKERLCQFVETFASDETKILHCRLHTLFGLGDPPEFMFLGQLFAAARARKPLEMTSGRQLREYQHVLDTALAVYAIHESGARGKVTISHGEPVMLRDIASSIAEALNFPELCKFGALPDPLEENYGVVFQPTVLPNGIAFRDTLSAVAQYATECV